MYSEVFAVQTYLREKEQMSSYIDKKYAGTEDDYRRELQNSCTAYLGNLHHNTKEEQIYLLFSKIAPVKRVIMGLDAHRYTPCGFCFIEFADSTSPKISRRYFSKTSIMNKHIYIDLDIGFAENRQYGRGISGGQIREERIKNMHKRRRVG